MRDAYPDGLVFFIANVYNCDTMERKLINIFKERYVHRKDIGMEYFTGDINAMRITFMTEILNETLDIQHKADKYAMIKNAKEPETNDSCVESCAKECDLINLNNTVENMDNMDSDDLILSDTTTTIDFQETEGQSLSITTQVILNDPLHRNDDKENVGKFIKYVYDNKPDWYREKHSVDIRIIRNAYNMLFNSNINSTVISKYLQGKMFHIGSRSNNITTKKLVSYSGLKRHIFE